MKKEVSLHINRIHFSVHLGVTSEERKLPQAVEVTIRLSFPEGLMATQTDKLSDTVCYFDLVTKLKPLCEKKEFNLIEHFGMIILRKVKEIIGPAILVQVAASKVSPPVPEITGGVTFICGDSI